MVKKSMFFWLLPFAIFGGEFQASVSSNQVLKGESFILDLTLKNSSAKGTPTLEPLKQAFTIHSQQQSSKTSIINGSVSSSLSWKFTLMPLKEGSLTIPAITIDTSDGVLSTDPITIQVGGAAIDAIDTKGITLTADVSRAKPYKNEPLIYTIKLLSTKNLANIEMQKFTVDDAIVEQANKPKIYESIVHGMRVAVVEFSYLLTPLKSGSLKIPSTVIQGVIPMKRRERRSLFDDPFEQLKPFAVTTDEMTLDVQPALPMNPWLPAQSLRIEESWNGEQKLHAGDPITREFRIVAEGLLASQLPSLNELQVQDGSFKVYADKPNLRDEIREGNIRSYREEKYTLLPQQAGRLTLPEITLAWWDVAKQEKAYARVPARTLEILPSPELPPPPLAVEPKIADTASSSPLLYLIIGALVLCLIGAIAWIIALQIKIHRVKTSKKEAKKEKWADLNPT